MGELRLESEEHINSLIKSLSGVDVYVSTYSKYERTSRILGGDNVLFLDQNYYYGTPPQSNMYQWQHLDNLIDAFGTKLQSYKNIYKIRTDTSLGPELFEEDVAPNTVYAARSDCVFFAESAHFLNVFSGFWSDIEAGKYTGNLMLSKLQLLNLVETRNPKSFQWGWSCYPRKVWHSSFDIIKERVKNIVDEQFDTRDYVCHTPKWVKEGFFSSEAAFCFRCLNYGYMEGAKYHANVSKSRKTNTYLLKRNRIEFYDSDHDE